MNIYYILHIYYSHSFVHGVLSRLLTEIANTHLHTFSIHIVSIHFLSGMSSIEVKEWPEMMIVCATSHVYGSILDLNFELHSSILYCFHLLLSSFEAACLHVRMKQKEQTIFFYPTFL